MFWRNCCACARQKLGEGGIALPACQLGKLPEHGAQEKAQPDALAAALHAHPVHAVVPVAAAHQRQAMHPEAQAVADGAHAMFVQAG